MATQARMEIAPIAVHYNFRPYLRICRDVGWPQISAEGAGRQRSTLVKQLPKSNLWQTIAAPFYLLLMCRKNYKEKTFQATACLLRSVYA